MIHYHGTPLTPIEVAMRVLRGRHAFISYAAPGSLEIAADICQSFALDNGAFSAWRKGVTIDWGGYYAFCDKWHRHPGFDWAVIPDVIDGTEKENDTLLVDWPRHLPGVPVWHLHESFDRLRRLMDTWPRIALGSGGAYDTPNSQQWWIRMQSVMNVVCDKNGYPKTKLHGLRMLNPEIFALIPFASCDSTNICQNKGTSWKGRYEPATAATKAVVIAERIELSPHANYWNGWRQDSLLMATAT